MVKTLKTPSNSLHKEQSKDNRHLTQLKTIFQYLQDNIATASMVTDATGVPQKCITRYKRDLERAGYLWEVTKTYCKKTGFKAWYLTTDETKVPNHSNQLNLF
jgi:predicted transcriptional regulator